MKMNFRPEDDNLLNTCIANEFCTQCSMRVGCPRRYQFYFPNFEIKLQVASYVWSKKIGPEAAYELEKAVRRKMLTETGKFPGGYNYT